MVDVKIKMKQNKIKFRLINFNNFNSMSVIKHNYLHNKYNNCSYYCTLNHNLIKIIFSTYKDELDS